MYLLQVSDVNHIPGLTRCIKSYIYMYIFAGGGLAVGTVLLIGEYNINLLFFLMKDVFYLKAQITSLT